MKSLTIKKAAVAFSAVISTFLLMNIVCFLFYHLPYWFDRDTDATSSIWRPGSFILQMKEGFGLNYVDENGYVNSDKPLASSDYILTMGSSHTQGKEVSQGNRFTDIMDSKLGNGKELTVYNMACDGNYYTSIVKGFDASIAEVPKAKAVVIEIPSTDYTSEELNDCLVQRDYDMGQQGKSLYSSMSRTQKIKAFIKENLPIVNLIKKQSSSIRLSFSGAFGLSRAKTENESVSCSDEEYYTMIKKTAEHIRKSFTGQVIVVYHPEVVVDSEGNYTFKESEHYNPFKQALIDSGVTFLDMNDRFCQEYKEKKVLPYGFNNTVIGEGHLNKYGHRMIADELCKILGAE